MLKLTPQEAKSVLKASKGKNSISAKDYREAISNSKHKISKGTKHNFSFSLEVIKISDIEYNFILTGRHLSTNSVNSLGRGDSIRYKNSIKHAFNDYFLMNRFKRPKHKFPYAEMTPIFYNPRSRDDDSDAGTMKIVRDSIVNAGYLVDDDRKHLKQHKYQEIISKEWKIIVNLKSI
jgi:hypothetical protein